MHDTEAIRFYCGVSEQQWNHHPVAPGRYACVSPVYGRTAATKAVNRVCVPDRTLVIQDSGAFSDKERLSNEQALERQIAHAEQFGHTAPDGSIIGYAPQITHRASYDLLIDEKWEGGIRHKARWSEQDAELAVKMTVAAAHYLSQHRNGLGAVLSAQGVSARQYLKCAEQIIPFMVDGDIFGLGGWCITGKMPAQMLPVFRETMHMLIPFLASEGVKLLHIWGVIYPKALGELLKLCDMHGLKLSTDSAGPQVKPCFGSWGYGSWHDPAYQRPSAEIRGLERARHVELTRDWLDHFPEREPECYRFVPIKQKPVQLELLAS